LLVTKKRGMCEGSDQWPSCVLSFWGRNFLFVLFRLRGHWRAARMQASYFILFSSFSIFFLSGPHRNNFEGWLMFSPEWTQSSSYTSRHYRHLAGCELEGDDEPGVDDGRHAMATARSSHRTVHSYRKMRIKHMEVKRKRNVNRKWIRSHKWSDEDPATVVEPNLS
jgi:hypothetical protein